MEPTFNQLHRLLKDDHDRANGREPKRHHTVAAYAVEGRLDEGLLDAAWRAVQRDYPVLLTSFEKGPMGWRWLTDEPIEPAGLQLATSADEAASHRLAQRWVDTPFRLAEEPLARLGLIQFEETRSVMVLVAEHLVSDGWSTQCLFRRLSDIYRELRDGGQPDPLDCESYLDQAGYERAQIAAITADEVAALAAQVLPALPVPVPDSVDHLRCRSVQLSYPAAPLAAAARRTLGPFGPSALVHAAAQQCLADVFAPGPAATLLTMALRYRRRTRAAVGWYVNKVPVAIAAPESFGRQLARALDRHPVPWTWLLATARPDAFGQHASCPYVGFNAMADANRRVAQAATAQPIGQLRKLSIDTGFWDAALMIAVDTQDDRLQVNLEAKEDFIPTTSLDDLADRMDGRLRSWAASPIPAGRATAQGGTVDVS
ncbi:MAG TPA: condensation domain-containing protein [Jatrophihabitans sp.]|nr:condensation domain-containing protein [Jatrophihabitans sp.]